MDILLAVFIFVLPGLLDISTPDLPGIYPWGAGFIGPRPNPKLHPHMRLKETMTSVPKVYPGDMVFWHCVTIFYLLSF